MPSCFGQQSRAMKWPGRWRLGGVRRGDARHGEADANAGAGARAGQGQPSSAPNLWLGASGCRPQRGDAIRGWARRWPFGARARQQQEMLAKARVRGGDKEDRIVLRSCKKRRSGCRNSLRASSTGCRWRVNQTAGRWAPCSVLVPVLETGEMPFCSRRPAKDGVENPKPKQDGQPWRSRGRARTR